MAMSDYSLSDIAAVTEGGGGGGGNRGGWGDGGGWWILLLFILLGYGGRGFGNQGGNGQGGGGMTYVAGGNELYPWLNQSNQINDGFRDQMINNNIEGIQQGVNNLSTQLCNCCGDVQMSLANGFAGVNAALCNGFNGVEQGANARQIANMQQAFAAQTAMSQGFNSLQSQFADCCCENRLGLANLNATILQENCADRAAISDGIRDVLTNQNANTQRILDQMCADKIDEKNDEIARLRSQVQMQNLAASQISQTAQIQAGQVAEVDALYSRLRDCPVPSMPVYGMQPIFTCQNNNCGCGCNNGCGCN